MADPSTGMAKHKRSLEYLFVPENKEVLKECSGHVGDTGNRLRELPSAKSETIWALKKKKKDAVVARNSGEGGESEISV